MDKMENENFLIWYSSFFYRGVFIKAFNKSCYPFFKGCLDMSLLKLMRLSQSCCLAILIFVVLLPFSAFSAVPRVRLDSVINVSCASAGVLGAVNPRGSDTLYRFDCLSSYDSFSSDWFNLPAGSVFVDVQYNLKDLKQNTEHKVSIYACNVDGCDFSNVKTFITKKCGVKILQWREVY